MSKGTKTLTGPRRGIMGNLKQIGPKAHVTWTKWSSMYGPVYQVHLGPMGESVVLGEQDVFKKAMHEPYDAFGGRFVLPICKKSGSLGTMTWENDEVFDHRRKLMISVFEKADLDKVAQNEVNAFCDMLSKSRSKPSDTVYRLIYEANLNMTAAFCFRRGRRCQYDDPEFKELVRLSDEMLKARHNLMAEPGNLFPWIWSTCMYSGFRRIHNNLRCHINKELTTRQNENVAVTAIQDVMDGYLAKVDGIEFPVDDCIAHSMNLVGATITLKNALQWLILLISKHPEIQTKIQEEITNVFGDKAPTIDDVDKLPYTNAAIYETLRLACPAAQVVPHMTKADVKFEGYDIKKGTVVFGNLWGLHHDAKYWDEPETFKPERFLNTGGQLDLNKDSYLPFGLGTRRCPGEKFAIRAMFLFVASVYQRFGFEKEDSLPEVDDGVIYAGLHNPPPYKLNIVAR